MFRAYTALMAGLLMTGLLQASSSWAASYVLQEGYDVIGQLRWTRARSEDTLVSVARSFDLGYRAILNANPTVDVWLPEKGSRIILPNAHILPAGPREGLVLNLAEMRLYFYPDSAAGEVNTYPVGIGREGWRTPSIKTWVKAKHRSPSWYPPASIRREALENGITLPTVVPPGPDNPLGEFALRLSVEQYLIHGTNRPAGVGMRVSHGCIRLFPEDIRQLFFEVELGARVRVVDEPYKAGWRGNDLLLEVHTPAYSGAAGSDVERQLNTAVMMVLIAATPKQSALLDWDIIKGVVRNADGIPTVIGRRQSAPE